MSIKIEISDIEASDLLEFYKGKLTVVQTQIGELLAKKNTYQGMIDRIIGNSQNHTITASELKEVTQIFTESLDYPKDGTIISKIKYVLYKASSPKTSREISDRMLLLENDSNMSKADKEKTIKNVSSVLSINQGEDKPFNRTTDSEGNNLFTLNPNYKQ